MRLLKETLELRADSEESAKECIEQYREEAKEKGYIITAAGYTYKSKKAKGEIISEKWVCKIVLEYTSLWEED